MSCGNYHHKRIVAPGRNYAVAHFVRSGKSHVEEVIVPPVNLLRQRNLGKPNLNLGFFLLGTTLEKQRRVLA